MITLQKTSKIADAQKLFRRMNSVFENLMFIYSNMFSRQQSIDNNYRQLFMIMHTHFAKNKKHSRFFRNFEIKTPKTNDTEFYIEEYFVENPRQCNYDQSFRNYFNLTMHLIIVSLCSKISLPTGQFNAGLLLIKYLSK